MPQPTSNAVHVNAPLSNVSLAFLQDYRSTFVADRVFPNVPVAKKSDVYFTYDKYAWFSTQAKVRAPSTESAGSGYGINTDNYNATVRAVHKDVDDQIRSNADAAIRPDLEATEFVTRQLVLRKERDFADTYFTTGVWTGSTTGTDITPGNLWDTAGSTPIADMRAQIQAVFLNNGFKPNKLVLGHSVWNALQDNPDFIDRIKFVREAVVTEDLLARVLGIDEVLVGGGIQFTNEEGATDTPEFIFGNDALLVYTPRNPGLLQPAAGYTFSWTGYLGANQAGMRILRFRLDSLRSDRIEGEMAYDQKLVSADLGAFFSNCVA